jgi:hypothetical protein
MKKLIASIWGLYFLVVALVFMLQHYSPLPLSDAWDDNIPLFFNLLSSHLHWASLFDGHNAHRLLWMRLLFLFQSTYFPHHPVVIFIVTYGLTFLSTLGLIYGFQRTQTKSDYWFWGIIVSLMFAPGVHTLWLWAYLVQFPLTVVFVVLVMLFVSINYGEHSRDTWGTLFGLVILCELPMFGMANGLMVWPATGLLLLFYRINRWRALVFALIAVVSVALYMRHNQSTTGMILTEPLTSFHYFMNFFGGILPYPGGRTHLVVGVLACLSFLVSLYTLFRYGSEQAQRAAAPWVALALFVVFNVLMASVIRISVGGASEALASRYVAYTALFYVSLFVCVKQSWHYLSTAICWVFRFLACVFLLFLFAGSFPLLVKQFYVKGGHLLGPSSVALPFHVILPFESDLYFPGNHHIVGRLIHYTHSPLYPPSILQSHQVHVLPHNAIAAYVVSHEKRSLNYYRQAQKTAHAQGFRFGYAITGALKSKAYFLRSGTQPWVIRGKHGKLCGAVVPQAAFWARERKTSIPFVGFVLPGCLATNY